MEYATEALGALLTIISTYIGITVAGIKSETKIMSRQLGEINGSVKTLKEWSEGHERLDEERFHSVREAMKG